MKTVNATHATKNPEPRWLLLIHQIPPKPAYFRAKVGRRLQRIGAVAIKNSVYVAPLSEQSHEDLQWIAREIVSEGGEATLCTATFVEGLRDDQIDGLFHVARDAEYAQVADEAREIAGDLPPRLAKDDERRERLEGELARRLELGGRMCDALLALYQRRKRG